MNDHTEFLENPPFPYGLSLREHIGNYVSSLVPLIRLNTATAKDLVNTADEVPGTELGQQYLTQAKEIATTARTMAQIHGELVSLLEFVDWEHSFYQLDPEPAKPGEKTMLLKLIEAEEGGYKILLETHNGAQLAATIGLCRDMAERLRDGITVAIDKIDELEQDA